jgi:photosystem II stability/assembly factor-like uncharacterized protein
MAKKKRPGRSSLRGSRRTIIIALVVALAVAVLAARVFRAYQVRTADSAAEPGLKSIQSLYHQFPGNHIHGLGYDGRNDRLFVATHYGIFIWKGAKKLYQAGTNRDDFMGFSLHPSDADTIYTSGHPAAGGNMGVMKSEDGGISFKQIFRGLRGETVDFHSMTISPANPLILYGSFQGRLYRSKDGGRSWEFASARGLPPQGPCWGAPCLTADSRDERAVYAGTPRGLLVSRDFGENWSAVSEQLGAVAGVGIDASNPHRLFAFADNLGVALSRDGGKSWQARNGGMRLSQREFIFAFAFDPSDSGHVYVATPEQIFRSTDAGENWEKIL